MKKYVHYFIDIIPYIIIFNSYKNKFVESIIILTRGIMK